VDDREGGWRDDEGNRRQGMPLLILWRSLDIVTFRVKRFQPRIA